MDDQRWGGPVRCVHFRLVSIKSILPFVVTIFGWFWLPRTFNGILIIYTRCRWKMKVKRSQSLSPEPSSSQDCKRPRIEDEDETDEVKTFTPNILDLSDDVLLNILKYLPPQDLLDLAFSCKRFDRICRDRTLWTISDSRKDRIAMMDVGRYRRFLQPSTKLFGVRFALGPFPALRKNLLRDLCEKCQNLKELYIEECNINAHTVKVCNFPTTLETLSLKGCALQNFSMNDKSYLFKLDLQMPHLTTLILSQCSWLTPHSLMVLSKIPKLKELRLDSCDGLGECVAYASLATRFGFKTLEILDLRLTSLGDSEISCFSTTSTLTHLYLECPKSRCRAYCCRRADPRIRGGQLGVPDANLIEYLSNDEPTWDEAERCLISDRTVCTLGTTSRHRNAVMYPGEIVFEDEITVTANPNLKCLVLRNYPLVTNQSLKHLTVHAKSLEYLDVTGTAVTRDAVQTFKAARPNVKIITSFKGE